ncbi:hypothetical protein PUN28_019761 [Cardiocondyla obscurior]|uniref:Uncharacterized protein n=1 Tax=Cardiocondyla obscurior TaxID=286306 RepID=A0AAW2E7A3_9HYME
MFALALFPDGTYHICKETDVIKGKTGCSIKYKNKKRYAGNIVAYNDSYNKLLNMKTKFESLKIKIPKQSRN